MNPQTLTLGQAVKHIQCSKATLSKALNKGDLSGTRQPDGSWRINPAELARWNSERSTRGQKIATRTAENSPSNTPEHLENSVLQARLEVTEGRLADAQATIEDLRARLDAEQEERRVLMQRLLPAPQHVPQTAVRRRSFLGWFARANT